MSHLFPKFWTTQKMTSGVQGDFHKNPAHLHFSKILYISIAFGNQSRKLSKWDNFLLVKKKVAKAILSHPSFSIVKKRTAHTNLIDQFSRLVFCHVRSEAVYTGVSSWPNSVIWRYNNFFPVLLMMTTIFWKGEWSPHIRQKGSESLYPKPLRELEKSSSGLVYQD